MNKKSSNPKEIFFKNLAVESQAGDEENYKKLLTEIVDRLRPFLYYHLFDENAVECVLQDILKTVNSALHTYNVKDSFLNWLFAIVEYKLTRHLRKYQKISYSDISYSEYLLTIENNEILEVNEQLEELFQQALDKLPEQQRQLILILRVREYFIDDVSIELNISVRKAKRIAYQAYKNLREELVK